MSIEAHRDVASHHEIVTNQRNVIVQRLMRALEALDRRRHRVAEVVDDVASFFPGHRAEQPSPTPSLSLREGARTALAVAVASGVVLALDRYLDYRRRERRRPLRVLQRAWLKYAMPAPTSAVTRLVTEAIESLVLSVARAAASAAAQWILDARATDNGPEIIERLSDAPDPTFVLEPVIADPGARHPRGSALAPSGLARLDPVAPLQSPLREAT